ncbi:hypothetical protein HYALB_00013985 [Hymenoscyphus albidus]|uniref:Uncharacterized protein n=1 Tax=Hymenoscyphus albidus TaxID=595503 RepID=A0A9N9LZ95_9HELO|nr:hypothetical protein HYALB_00013985 [Hymenoscyphus albidus]
MDTLLGYDLVRKEVSVGSDFEGELASLSLGTSTIPLKSDPQSWDKARRAHSVVQIQFSKLEQSEEALTTT